ncbi:hypothetical protein [uncultured Shewanella sp.]|uniref:hypothetical protein n=1 Tax=uncultured Shewanella sp. TaxID=173975 RepID=UPI0026321C40|nr:hypothetical protein [uncultured Shewanella sp.]
MKKYNAIYWLFLSHTLLTLPAYAGIQHCDFPDNLTNIRIILQINSMHNSTTAETSYLRSLTFTETHIQDMNMTTGKTNQGTYQYVKLAKGIGLISVILTQGPEQAIYKDLFVCKTSLEGKFIFSQRKGTIKPDLRQDIGSYVIQSPFPEE